MSHSTFRRTMWRDYVILMVAVVVIVAVARFGAEWLAGFLVLVVIPAALIVIVVLDGRQSRRRDGKSSDQEDTRCPDNSVSGPAGSLHSLGRPARIERRRVNNPPGADHALTSEQPATQQSTNAPNATGPAALSSCRPGRPDLATAWVDFAWACHWSALRRWRSTRPGR